MPIFNLVSWKFAYEHWFIYLYRDGANYKQYHSIVFPNHAGISLKEIQTTITNHLIDQSWFIAKEWNLPDLHYKEYPWDNEIDHEWHEFASVEETDAKETTDMPVEEFLKRIAVKK